MGFEVVYQEPLISIVVPIYNVEKYLKQCIMSIIEQTYEHLEIILIDDGSTDNSAEICDQFAYKEPRIVAIHQNNAGVSAARNTGIVRARGEYVAFVDGDDFISPHMIKGLYSRIVQDQSDIAICGYRRVDEEGHELSVISVPNAVVSGVRAIKMHYEDTGGMMPIPVNKLYQRRVLDQVQFPEGKRCEDEATFYRILDLCEKVSILSEPYYSYVQHADSFMGGNYSVQRLDGVEVSYERYLFYRNQGDRYRDLLQPEGKAFAWLFYDVIRHFHPKTNEEAERIQEIYRIAGEMYSQKEVKWTMREKLKLRYPEIYVSARIMKDRLLRSRGS